MKRNEFSYPFQIPMNYAVLVDEFKTGSHVQELKISFRISNGVLTSHGGSYQFFAKIWTLPCEGANVPECHPLSNQGRKPWGGSHADKRNDVRVV